MTHRQLFRNVYQGISQSITCKACGSTYQTMAKRGRPGRRYGKSDTKRNELVQRWADMNEIRVTETEDTSMRQTTKIQWGEAANKNETNQEQE